MGVRSGAITKAHMIDRWGGYVFTQCRGGEGEAGDIDLITEGGQQKPQTVHSCVRIKGV